MKADYLKFVQWSEPDQRFVGYCPDLFIGGVCHGSDEQKKVFAHARVGWRLAAVSRKLWLMNAILRKY